MDLQSAMEAYAEAWVAANTHTPLTEAAAAAAEAQVPETDNCGMDSLDQYCTIFEYLCDQKRKSRLNIHLPPDVEKDIKNYKIEKCSGHLYYSSQGSWLKILRSDDERTHSLKTAHVDDVSGFHHNISRTIAHLRTRLKCYWNSVAEDVKKYIDNCNVCNPISDSAIDSTKNWRQVLIKVLGPFRTANQGNKFVAVVVDPISLWIDGSVLESNSDQHVSSFIFNTFIHMGFCQCNVLEVEKEYMKNLSSKLNFLYNELLEYYNCHEVLTTSDGKPTIVGDIKDVSEKDNSVGGYKKEVPCRVIQPSDVNLYFGDEFAETLANYIRKIDVLIETHPLKWEEKLDFLFFKLRSGSQQCQQSAPFYKMLRRHSLIQEHIQDLIHKENMHGDSDDNSGVNLSSNESCRSSSHTRQKTVLLSPKSKDVNKTCSLKAHGAKLYVPRRNLKLLKRKGLDKALQSCTTKQRKMNRSSDCDSDICAHSTTPVRLISKGLPDGNSSSITDGDEIDDMKEIHVTIVTDNAENENETNQQDDSLMEDDNSDFELAKKDGLKRARKLEKELPHKCPKCIATYLATADELGFHLKCHIPGKSMLKCPNCPKTVRNWSHLTRHLISHEELAKFITLIPEDRRTCNYCSKIFTSREGKLRHELVIHKGISNFECGICKEQFKERKTYKRHLDLHANVVHKCDHCNYSTKVMRNFVEHGRIHEGRGYGCPICKKVFTKQSVLVGHMDIHNTNRKSFMCEQCGMKLANPGSLRQHIRNMHENPGMYPCKHCSYIGKTRSNLTGHTDRCHNKPLKCLHCSYCTKSENSLKRHVDIFHNESERKFACSSCPYRARDPKHLAEHMRFRHSPNLFRFPCQYCSMKFKTMTMLRHHLPSHTGQHLYSCQLCGYSAKYRQTVHHHVKVKHPGESPSNVVKGTPCSEIPCDIPNEQMQKHQQEDEPVLIKVSEILDQVVISEQQENSLFVANKLTAASKPADIIVDASRIIHVAVDESALTTGDRNTIQFQTVEGGEEIKNLTENNAFTGPNK